MLPLLALSPVTSAPTAEPTPEPSPTSTSVATEALPADIVDASATTVLLYVAVGVGAAFVLGLVVTTVLRRLGRRSPLARDVEVRGRRPFRILLVLVAVRVVLEAATEQAGWASPLAYLANLAIIGMIAWLAAVVAFVVEDLTLAKYRLDSTDNRRARRVQTQVSLLRRLTVAAVVVLAVGAMLLTIPAAREYGATVFASAGVLGIVAGLAAQTSLANVFAGLQIAFTDIVRMDDVVVVEEEWGRIEEITLTYVVVHIWDDRRLILPTTYFTSTPIENWTRKDSQVLGDVMLDLDWTAPLAGLRTEMHRVLAGTELWDGRVGLLQVMDAVGGSISVRVLVSAVDGPTLADLRAEMREALVVWLQSEHPEALPHSRVQNVEEPAGAAARVGRVAAAPVPAQPAGSADQGLGATAEEPRRSSPTTGETGLFTGSIAAVTRAKDFQGPSEQAMADRRRADDARSGHLEEDEPRTWRDEVAGERETPRR